MFTYTEKTAAKCKKLQHGTSFSRHSLYNFAQECIIKKKSFRLNLPSLGSIPSNSLPFFLPYNQPGHQAMGSCGYLYQCHLIHRCPLLRHSLIHVALSVALHCWSSVKLTSYMIVGCSWEAHSAGIGCWSCCYGITQDSPPTCPGYEMMLHGRVGEHMEKLLKCLVELRDIIMVSLPPPPHPPSSSSSSSSSSFCITTSLICTCTCGQEPIPVLEQFLELVLENWNGDVYRKEVFQLLSHISLQPFDSEEEEEEEGEEEVI